MEDGRNILCMKHLGYLCRVIIDIVVSSIFTLYIIVMDGKYILAYAKCKKGVLIKKEKGQFFKYGNDENKITRITKMMKK